MVNYDQSIHIGYTMDREQYRKLFCKKDETERCYYGDKKCNNMNLCKHMCEHCKIVKKYKFIYTGEPIENEFFVSIEDIETDKVLISPYATYAKSGGFIPMNDFFINWKKKFEDYLKLRHINFEDDKFGFYFMENKSYYRLKNRTEDDVY
jgi:hypothetical protein